MIILSTSLLTSASLCSATAAGISFRKAIMSFIRACRSSKTVSWMFTFSREMMAILLAWASLTAVTIAPCRTSSFTYPEFWITPPYIRDRIRRFKSMLNMFYWFSDKGLSLTPDLFLLVSYSWPCTSVSVKMPHVHILFGCSPISMLFLSPSLTAWACSLLVVLDFACQNQMPL